MMRYTCLHLAWQAPILPPMYIGGHVAFLGDW